MSNSTRKEMMILLPQVHGDLTGIRKNIIDSLQAFYTLSIPYGQIITTEIAEQMLVITDQINREVAVYINRRGQVVSVSIGSVSTIDLPYVEGRKSEFRLSGIRCIHTHPGVSNQLSGPDLSALKAMRYDIMVALSQSNKNIESSVGFISSVSDDTYETQTLGPLTLSELLEIDLTYLTSEIETILDRRGKSSNLAKNERALLVGVEQQNGWDVVSSLCELAQLTETAGAEVIGTLTQKKDRPDPAFFIGRGKLDELRLLRQEQGANIIIFDDELSPAQQRNLEQSVGIKVLDRTALILDIFAQRARSHEGKLQVELAQLKYSLPRLGGQGLVLSRLGGGIGTRGPGETKLEVDRRRIRSRISDIEKEIDNIKKHRGLHRERRKQSQISTIALVGYTNAGKSTLLNRLTDAGVLAEDKLFATLDPTTRRIALPSGREALLTDTVGFIQKLPHHLVAAFRATFEEVIQADLLLHVLDISHPMFQEQSNAVFEVLREFKSDDKPTITVFNKIDAVSDQHLIERCLRQPSSVAISAATGQGIDKLFQMIDNFLSKHMVELELLLPYEDSSVLSKLYETGIVHNADYREEGIRVQVSLQGEALAKYQKYSSRS